MKNSKFTYIILVVICILLSGCSSKKADIPIQMKTGEGDYVARIAFKDYGSITFRLFEESSEEAVSSFIDLANSGYYENLSVSQIIEDYCVVIGSADTAISGNSEKAEAQNTKKKNAFYPFYGAVCISDKTGCDASQLMIIGTKSDFLSNLKELLEYKKITVPEYLDNAYGVEMSEEDLQTYYQYGGAPWLYGHTLVIGQIYDGFDVLDNISMAVTDDNGSYSPLESITIESVEIVNQ